MKVLQVNNIANTATNIQYGLEKNKVNSDILSFNNKYGFHYDIFKTYFRYNQPKRNILLYNTCKKYDVLHFHGGIGKYDYFLKHIKKKYDKKIIFHFHGSDLRMGYGLNFMELCDKKIVSTPDLLDFVDDAVYIKNCIKPNSYCWNPSNPLRFLHISDNSNLKGSDIINKAMDVLSKNYDLEYNEHSNILHSECLNYIRNNDIVLNEINKDIGFHGIISLEAMSMGKIPVCYIQDKHRENFLPIISPDEPNVSSLVECVRGILENKFILGNKSQCCYDYVKNNLDPVDVCKKYIKIYEELLK